MRGMMRVLFTQKKVKIMPYSGSAKRRIINVLLIIMAISLSWVIYAHLKRAQQAPEVLYQDSIGQLMQRIQVKLPGQPTILMQAEGALWVMTQPIEASVNTQALQQLTTLLYEPIQAQYPVEGKKRSDFGLDDSAISVSFNGVEYRLGDLNPVNHLRYVLHEDRILMVNEVVYELLSRGVDGFIEEQ